MPESHTIQNEALAEQVKDEPIFVSSEWAELKECVYGGYNQFVFPKFLSDADVRPSGEFRIPPGR